MIISELFERDPKRRIEPVVSVNQHDPSVVFTEIDEYVVTDEIRRAMGDLIDRFLESRMGQPPAVCAWISGFFGSGKSMLLKVLGYMLANRAIELPGGSQTSAATYFCDKHQLPYGPILAKELITRPVFVNLLDWDREDAPPLTHIAYRALLTELGLSDIEWVAEIERQIQQQGLWDRFLAFVQESEKASWQEVRRKLGKPRTVLARALNQLDPDRYPDLAMAERSMDDAQRDFRLDGPALARRLLEEAEVLDPDKGRVVLLLDEVGLFVGTEQDRLTDLQSLAEAVHNIGRGKVWLMVTAQEALEEKIPQIEAISGQFQKLRDRFRILVMLTPENIDTVVKKRLLSKKADPAVQQELRGLYEAQGGTLAQAVTIRNPARDYRNLFTRLDAEGFVNAYPLLPYHVRLMQEIFSILRQRGMVARRLTGMERAVLAVVQAALKGVDERPGLADRPVGELATFDMVYDAIARELQAVSGAEQAAIAYDIPDGEHQGISVRAVAKALFLLQHVRTWLPTTVENLSAVLYPRIGADRNKLEQGVRQGLAALRQGVWVIEEEGQYRFLTEVERSFEQDVEKKKPVHETKKRVKAEDILRLALRDLKSYNYRNLRSFNVAVTADGLEVSGKGHLKLEIYSPYRVAHERNLMQMVEARSLANRDTVYWVARAEDRFEKGLERLIAVQETLGEYAARVQSDREQEALDPYYREVDTLERDDLPKELKDALAAGKIIYMGQQTALDSRKSVGEIFNEQMKELAEELFTEFDLAAFAVQRDEHIGAILTWTGGRLPAIYRELDLVDDDGNVLTERPVAARVLAEVNRRAENPMLQSTGGAIADFFEAPPYGWDPRIVRLTLAALFRNGSITVNVEGTEYDTARQARSHDAFTNARAFNRSRFGKGVEVPPEVREKASRLISELLGEWGGNTLEEIDTALGRVIPQRQTPCHRLLTTARNFDLPVREGLDSLAQALTEVTEATTRSARINRFVEDERVTTLQAQLPVLKALEQFEKKGNLDRYRAIRAFAQDDGLQLAEVEGDPDLVTKLEDLSHALAAPDFLERWGNITSAHTDLQGRYEQRYRVLAARRQEAAQVALKVLKKHKALKKCSKEERKRALAPLAALAESAEPGTGPSLKVLQEQILTVPTRQAMVQADLDARLTGEGEEVYVAGFEETVEVSSPEELTPLTARVTEVASRAKAAGKTLKVSIKVDVSQRDR